MKRGAALRVVCLCMVTYLAAADKPSTEHRINPPYALARGFGNLMTGWLEIPRGLIYENARIPIVGFVAGPVKGAFLVTWRTVAGATDVLCMGLTGKGLYTRDVPDFVWDAAWLPAPQEYRATATVTTRESRPRQSVATHCSTGKDEQPRPCALQPREVTARTNETQIETEEVKLIEWTTPPRHGVTTLTDRTETKEAAKSGQVASSVASTPRRKVRVTIPFDLGPTDDLDRRIKAMDARIAEIEKRAGIWR